MNTLIALYKPQGMTPLELINKLKQQYPEYKNEKIGYAGRLDPLAHGVVLLMVGEATKERSAYLALSKQYEFVALFGIATDTHDILGLVNDIEKGELPKDFEKKITQFVQEQRGKKQQPYPVFSSKTVAGKPLFWWAKEGKLSEINIPQREIEVFYLDILSRGKVTAEALKKQVKESLMVKGDFRQKAIGERWGQFFAQNPDAAFITTRFVLSCSSGTYVRSLVDELGKELGTGAVALEILRTSVGEYAIADALHLK